MNNITVEKITIASGLGSYSKPEIQKVKNHLSSLFLRHDIGKRKKVFKNGVFSEQKLYPITFVQTKSRKSIPNWTKKNQEAGIKTDLRSYNKDKLLSLLLKKNVVDLDLKNFQRTINVPIKDHRSLKLEPYNFLAPDYGLTFHIVLCPIIRKPYYKKDRRKSTKKIKAVKGFKDLRTLFNKYLQKEKESP